MLASNLILTTLAKSYENWAQANVTLESEPFSRHRRLPPLLLPSKAFPAADEKCSIPDGQKFWWPVLWWLYESGVQYFLGSNSQSQFLASISYMNWHLPGISNFLLQQDLAKWEPLATKGLLATLAIWLVSTMVPVPHKIDSFKLYIVDSD